MNTIVEIDDVPAQLTTINPVIVGVPMMDEQEARACVTRIKTRIDAARGELLELKDREGWKALGYSSWGVCARQEFGGSAATLYRQVEAAEIERSLGDSQIENRPIPTAQLQAVKQLAPEQRVEAFKRATELAGDQPRTAKHIAAAAAEIAAPDLPMEFAVIQRRMAKHDHILSEQIQGQHRVYSIKREGMTGIATFQWSDVLDRLERMDANPPPPPPAPDHGVSDRTRYEQQERADKDILAEAIGMLASARALINSVSVATWRGEKAAREIAPEQAKAFLLYQQDRMTRFSDAAMISQTTFKEALSHIAAWMESLEATK